MNIGKKLCAFALTATMMLANNVSANAEENLNKMPDPLQEAVSNLEEGYSEYYDILDTKTTLCSSHEVDGNIENIYLLEMQAVLKADSVEEMDYYQGVKDYYTTTEENASRLRSQNIQQRIDLLSSEKLEIYEQLEEYIGEEQSLLFYMKEIYSITNETEKVILFENGMDYVSWEAMLPSSPEKLQENGYARMAELNSEYVLSSEKAALQATRASYTYNVTDAVNYMLRFTSNPTSCNVCGNASCKSKADTTKYNSNYTHYASKHSDCANYVSQALSDGGIPEDNTWKPESRAWINVSELTSYMTRNGYWASVSYGILQKGDIVSFTPDSHVAMITAFDGTTYRYSGHTSDRRNVVLSVNSSTTYTYYRAG